VLESFCHFVDYHWEWGSDEQIKKARWLQRFVNRMTVFDQKQKNQRKWETKTSKEFFNNSMLMTTIDKLDLSEKGVTLEQLKLLAQHLKRNSTFRQLDLYSTFSSFSFVFFYFEYAFFFQLNSIFSQITFR